MTLRKNGFSLIETAVAVAILGIALAGLLMLWRSSHQQSAALSQRDLLERAEESLVAYARFNARLPCPAADTEGVESCTTASKGYFPWKTVGLPVQAARNLRYGVFRQAGSTGMKDSNLTVASDRFAPLATSGSQPVAVESYLGNVNGIDFCHALRVAALNTDNTTSTDTLYVANGSTTQNVAFALALPGQTDADGDGSPFDGVNATSSTGFQSPQYPSSTTYDDSVRTLSFGALYSDLACGPVTAFADHAHFNVATGASMMRQAMNDYYVQLVMAVQLATASVESTTATVIITVADILTATASVETATSEALVTVGASAASEALAIAGVVAAGVAQAAADVQEVQAALVLVDAQDNRDNLDGKYHLQTDATTLESEILTNAKNADAAGL